MRRAVPLLAIGICVMLLAAGCSSRMSSVGHSQAASSSTNSEKAAPSKLKPSASNTGPRPTASALLKSLRRTYSSLRSLRQEGVSTTVARADGKIVGTPHRSTISFLFKRPGRFIVSTDRGRLTSDGKTVYSYNPSARQYVKGDPTDVVRGLIMSRAGIGTMGLLYGANYDNAIGKAKLLPDAKLNGRDAYVLALELKSGGAGQADVRGIETLWIDKKDTGLRRIQVILAYKPQQTKNGKSPKLIQSEMTTDLKTFEGNIQVSDSAFAFKPPAGSRLVQQPEPVDISGKLAPDFPFVWTDGTTRKLSDFAGKPVLLDFWALPMCEHQLPILQSLDRHLGPGAQLITVCLNKDRAAVQQYVKKKGYAFPVVYVDAGAARALAQGYGLSLPSLPTMVILDRRGLVRAALSGVASEKEIRAKLAQVR